jgi:glyoxylase-like metal-dependent hydrolase (beta-lactamase superfamily II)
MHEIAPHVFIETEYPGVTLGAIGWERGLILIDVPFRPDDIRLWRSSAVALSHGNDHLLVNLDEHYDRTLGSRQIECVVLGHEKMTQLFKDRPTTFKPQTIETGAEWEMHNSLGSIRWAPPEITFSDQMEIHWNNNILILESHPGPTSAAIWAELPTEQIVFVGDAVVPHAPPFLANANLPEWMETLEELFKPEFRKYTLVSGRGGIITLNDVKNQQKSLEKMAKTIEKFGNEHIDPDEINKVAQHILKNFDVPRDREQQYFLRLRYGLSHYVRKQLGTLVETTE